MKRKRLYQRFIIFGLLLFFTALMPFTSWNTATAYASEIEKEVTESYRLNVKSVTLVKDKSYALKVYNLDDNSTVSFKSDDTEIASVSEDGLITANKVGETVVTVTIKNGLPKEDLLCAVTVGPAAISVKWTKSKIFIGVNQDDILKVILKPDNTTEAAKFSSYDASIASISSGGRLSARKIGMTYLFAEINATNLDGTRKFAVCTVFVTNTDDAPLLESYFNEHTELNRIPYFELLNALGEFFNSGSAAMAVSSTDTSESDLITALDSYLEDTFQLSDIRAQIKAEAEAALSNTTNTDTNSTDQAKTDTIDQTKTGTDTTDQTKANTNSTNQTK